MNGTSEIVPYLSGAASVMYVQRWMKTRAVYQRFVREFPVADRYAHLLIASIGSLVVAVGIGYKWDWTPAAGGGLYIAVPAWEVLRHGAWDWFNVFVLQQGWYDATRTRPIP